MLDLRIVKTRGERNFLCLQLPKDHPKTVSVNTSLVWMSIDGLRLYTEVEIEIGVLGLRGSVVPDDAL